VIHGGFSRGWAKRGAETERAGRAWVELVRVGWGLKESAYRRMFAELFIPNANEEQITWFTELQRRSTKPEIAARIMEASGVIDVSHRLGQVKAPTLVMHPRGDVIVPFEQGRIIAAGVPNARFVELDSGNHLLLESEPSWQKFQEVVGEFLGWPRTTPKRRADDAPVVDGELASLTAREREILDLVAGGANNSDIAARLFISEKTVRNHLTAIFDKLGVSSRSQAIVYARDRGLATRPH
jgi:DNA-binding CsgD family transcriptional regulator